MIERQKQVTDGKAVLQSWIDDEEVQKTLVRCAEDDPYIDEFGQDITGYRSDDPEIDDDVFTSEEASGNSGSDPDSESGPE